MNGSPLYNNITYAKTARMENNNAGESSCLKGYERVGKNFFSKSISSLKDQGNRGPLE